MIFLRYAAALMLAAFAFGASAQAVVDTENETVDATQERVVAALSQNSVGITATFSGSEIFVFGAVERNRMSDARDDDLQVIITVTGPAEPVVIRRKSRELGIWVNTDSVVVDRAPSFYAVSSTGPLDEILNDTADLRYKITIDRAVRVVGEAENVEHPRDFADAVVRLRRESGIYYEQIGDVKITERKLFQTHFKLPANIVEGDYAARVFILREGRVIDDFETGIDVRKVGFERWIYNLAYEQSLLYGIMSIFVALLAGWGASEVFRLLRR